MNFLQLMCVKYNLYRSVGALILRGALYSGKYYSGKKFDRLTSWPLCLRTMNIEMSYYQLLTQNAGE